MSDDYTQAVHAVRLTAQPRDQDILRFYQVTKISVGEFIVRVLTEDRKFPFEVMPHLGKYINAEKTFVWFNGPLETYVNVGARFNPKEPYQLYRVTLAGAKLNSRSTEVLVTGVVGCKGHVDPLKGANELVRTFAEVDQTLASPAFASLIEKLGNLRIFDSSRFLEYLHEIHERLNYNQPTMVFSLFNCEAPVQDTLNTENLA